MAKLYETITAENWVKRTLVSMDQRCLLGHANLLYAGNTYSAASADIYHALDEAIVALYPERGRSIEIFNDHPDTTLEDVLRVCKCAGV